MAFSETKIWFIQQIKGLILICIISFLLAFWTNLFRDNPLPWIERPRLLKAGDIFPYVPLTKPKILPYHDYLGFPPDKKMITIEDIQADLLVLEVLNVFCFPCQTQALSLNEVFKLIEKRPDLRGRIKLLGVALGNNKQVVDSFISDYGLLFPLVPDPGLRAEKVIGPNIHTPFSLFIKRDAFGKLRLIVATHNAPVHNHQKLFEGLIKLMKTGRDLVDTNDLFEK